MRKHPPALVELIDIHKTYPGVTALAGVSLTIRAGEVVGLIGENGAGKSTLMKVLGGVVGPDDGVIRIDGAAHARLSVAQSLAAGIAFVHQELNLFDNLDVGANIMVGREPSVGGPFRFVDNARIRALVQPSLDKLGVDYGARTPVAELSIAQRQLLEIARALTHDARLIIMDEPTSSLTIAETDRLLRIVDELKADGIAIIYISHRLSEVARCADRVVVLRDGALAGTLDRGQIEHDRMIRLMIGRDLQSLYAPPARPPGDVALAVRGVRTAAFPESAVMLELRRGEILGLAGLMGSGRTELVRAIFGIDRMLAGEIRLDGAPVDIASPKDAIDRGIYLAPEDRKQEGLFLDMSIRENITLPDLRRHARGHLVDRASETDCAEAQRQRLAIRVPGVEVAANALSGGNQQKVVLAKWLAMRPRVILFDEPTRGIDVGAKNEIYRLLRELADAGVAVLMISSDMEEVIGVSDRIAVVHEGTIAGFLDRAEFSESNVLTLAVGTSIGPVTAPC